MLLGHLETMYVDFFRAFRRPPSLVDNDNNHNIVKILIHTGFQIIIISIWLFVCVCMFVHLVGVRCSYMYMLRISCMLNLYLHCV